MDENNSGRARRDFPRDVFGIQAESGVDIRQHRNGPCIHHGGNHRDPHIGGNDHLLARAGSQRRKRDGKRARSARYGHCVPDSHRAGELLLEFFGFLLQIHAVVTEQRFRAQHAQGGLNFLVVKVMHAGKF